MSRRRRRAHPLLLVALAAPSLLVATPPARAAGSDGILPALRPVGSASEAPALRVLDIGTGIDPALAPPGVTVRPLRPLAGVDTLGWSTAAASVMASLYPGSKLTIDAEVVQRASSGGFQHTSAPSLTGALAAAVARMTDADRSNDYHAILLDVDPLFFPDPETYWKAYHQWDGLPRRAEGWPRLQHQIGGYRFEPPGGSGDAVTGIPLADPAKQEAQMRESTIEATQFRARAGGGCEETWCPGVWESLRASLERLSGLGVPVVVPAGDVVPRESRSYGSLSIANVMQSAGGPAALESLLTVGAAVSDGAGGWRVPPTSGTGIAASGAVKPDLLAPADVTVSVPVSSRLAAEAVKPLAGSPCGGSATRFLAVAWTCSLEAPRWMEGGAPDGVGVVSAASKTAPVAPMPGHGSTNVAAAVVALQAAQLRARAELPAGAEADRIRSLVQAVASRTGVPGAPVFLQGSGVLARAPQPADLASLPLLGGSRIVPPAPAQAAGTRETTLPLAGAAPDAVTVRTTDFMGARLDGRHLVAPVLDGGQLAATLATGAVRVRAGDPVGMAGVYCGWVELTRAGEEPVRYPVCGARVLDVSVHLYYPGEDPPPSDPTKDPPERDARVGTARAVGDATVALALYVPEDRAVGMAFRLAGSSAPMPAPWSATTDGEGWATLRNVVPGIYTLRVYHDFSVAPELGFTGTGGSTYPRTEIGAPFDYQQTTVVVGSPLPCSSGAAPVDARNLAPACTPMYETWAGPKSEPDRTCMLPAPSAGQPQPFAPEIGPAPVHGVSFVCGPPKIRLLASVSTQQAKALTLGDFSQRARQIHEAPTATRFQDVCRDAVANTTFATANDTSGAWQWRAGQDEGALAGSRMAAVWRPAAPASSKLPVSVLHRPFTLPSPNFNATVKINVDYDVQDAAIIMVGLIRDEVKGTIITAPAKWNLDRPLQLWKDPGAHGFWATSPIDQFPSDPRHDAGQAGVEWSFLPDHWTTGSLCVIAVPLGLQPAVNLTRMTMQIQTWGQAPYERTTAEPYALNDAPYVTTVHTNQTAPVDPYRCHVRKLRLLDRSERTVTECDDMRVYVHAPLGASPVAPSFDYALDRVTAGARVFAPGTAATGVRASNPGRGIARRQGLLPYFGYGLQFAPVGSASVNGSYAGIAMLPLEVTNASATPAERGAVRLEYRLPQTPPALAPTLRRDGQFTRGPWRTVNSDVTSWMQAHNATPTNPIPALRMLFDANFSSGQFTRL